MSLSTLFGTQESESKNSSSFIDDYKKLFRENRNLQVRSQIARLTCVTEDSPLLFPADVMGVIYVYLRDSPMSIIKLSQVNHAHFCLYWDIAFWKRICTMQWGADIRSQVEKNTDWRALFFCFRLHFKYSHNWDQKGIIYWLGSHTNSIPQPFSNPIADHKLLLCCQTGYYNITDSVTDSRFVMTDPTRYELKEAEAKKYMIVCGNDNGIAFDFGPYRTVELDAVTLGVSYMPPTFLGQGLLMGLEPQGDQWKYIDHWRDDSVKFTLTRNFPRTPPFRYVRFLTTESTQWTILNQIEMYGVMCQTQPTDHLFVEPISKLASAREAVGNPVPHVRELHSTFPKMARLKPWMVTF